MRILALCALAWTVGCSDRGIETPGTTDGGGPSADLATAARCGGLTGLRCGAGAYCDFGATCGAGDQLGTCQLLPSSCTKELAPVCGCDQVTYSNPCQAHQAGISVLHAGACAPPPMSGCGGRGGAVCGSDQYCDFPDGSLCGGNDAVGVCTQRPQACTDLYAPVCGCDFKTYGNACAAASAGTDVARQGACDMPADCRVTGCPAGQSCQLCWANYACLPPNVVC